MKRSSSALVGLLSVCGGCAASHDVGGAGQALAAPIEFSAECLREMEDAVDGLPDRLECTGLYTDIATKAMPSEVQEFKPAYPLWSDGSVKTRWVFMPKGTSIDASNPNAWKFPDGTRFWKEFRNPEGTRRIETRIFVKNGDQDWSRTTYVWDDAEKKAMRLDAGKDIDIDGNTYHIPSGEQCNDCHGGRRDRVLGFDQVNLGLPGAENMSLEKLMADDRLKNLKGSMDYQIGPDPSNDEAQALGWLHTNCGVSCHNNDSNAKAYQNGMRLLLDPSQLDGRSTSEFQAIKTTIGQDVSALQWYGKKRIVAGSPDESWLYTLITSRGDPKNQMPPIASNQVDTNHTDLVKRWISNLPKAE